MLLGTCILDSHSLYATHTRSLLPADSDMLSGHLAWVYPRWHVNFNITMLRLVSLALTIIGPAIMSALQMQDTFLLTGSWD
jgi:hypothetical protein